MTIPNILSIFRIVLIFVYGVLFYKYPDAGVWAGIVLIISASTDALDGYIARKFNQTSDLGLLLDPLADKLTQFCVMLLLGIRFWPVLNPLILYIFFKEFLMLCMTIPLVKMKMPIFPSKWFGKITTFFIFTSTICFTIFPKAFQGAPMQVMCSLMILMLSASLFGYGRVFIKALCDIQLQKELSADTQATAGV